MQDIILETVSSPGCHNCALFEEFWETEQTNWPHVQLHKHDITTPEGQALAAKHMILASPGIIVNGELVSTGGVSKEALLAKLRALSQP